MPHGFGLTEARYRRTLATLVGRRVTSVVYYGLRYDPQHGVQWDFDQWHDPEMGVELVLDDGSVYSAVWGTRSATSTSNWFLSQCATCW